jgi:hypothetical protein
MNNRGFSLVQIIISLGLLSGLFVAALKIVQNQTELGKSSSYRFESLVIMDEVKSILSDPASCRESLKNLSGIFDEVATIKSYDPRDKKSEEAYSIHRVNNKVLGQNNLYLQSMVLNGEINGFSNDNGFTTLVMTFSDKERGGDTVKTVFPIKVVLNELGRIVDCQARPGIHQEKSSRTLNDPWNKVKDENGKVLGVSFNGNSVTIGQVAGLARLNAEGGILLYDSDSLGECNAETAGSLSFQPAKQLLQLCRNDGTWHPLHGQNQLAQIKKDFSVATAKNEPKVITTEEGYLVCRLVSTQTEAGQCSAAPVNRVLAQPQWELLSQNYRGKSTSCAFQCFR